MLILLTCSFHIPATALITVLSTNKRTIDLINLGRYVNMLKHYGWNIDTKYDFEHHCYAYMLAREHWEILVEYCDKFSLEIPKPNLYFKTINSKNQLL